MGWLWVVLAAALGAVAAWRLRARRYRYPDDEVRRDINPWWVPVVVGAGALLAAPFWAGQPVPVILTGVLALVWAVVLAVIDLEVRRLPDVLTLPAYPVLALLLAWSSVVTHDWTALARAAACSGIAVAVFTLLVVVSPGQQGVGWGDVKLVGPLAGLLGWFAGLAAVYGLLLGPVLGGVAAVALLVTRRVSRKASISYGPPLILGAYLVGALAPALVG